MGQELPKQKNSIAFSMNSSDRKTGGQTQRTWDRQAGAGALGRDGGDGCWDRHQQ